jgi:phosphoenolpyruvate mutase
MVGQIRLRPEDRRKKLKALLTKKPLIRVIEVHDGISSAVVSTLFIDPPNGGEAIGFDALWASSLTESAAKGLPDIELIGLDSRLTTIEQILRSSNKPVIVDGDTGRDLDSLEYFLTKLETLGASAIVIEDKTFPKRNSLDADCIQNLEDPEMFARKIKFGKECLLSEDFLIFARLESIIAGGTIEEALSRAKVYLKAGADGILIHSRDKTPSNVQKFAAGYNTLCKELGFRKPLICIPTTYDTIRESELKANGFNVVIYANHPMRASIKSMEDVCKLILMNERAFETAPYLTSVSKIFDIVGFSKIRQRDVEQSRIKAIIPAAGTPKENIVENMPIAMLDINGKCILQRQFDVLSKLGITDVVVVRDYSKEKFNVNRVKYLDISRAKRGSLYSLLAAKEEMQDGFILIFSDIIFDESVISNLLRSIGDITIVVDASYPIHKHEIDKELDLVICRQKSEFYRQPTSTFSNDVSFMGKKIKKDIATHEFIGIAKFSAEGAQNLIRVSEDCINNHKGKFHENESILEASIVDVLQEMIDRGFQVKCLETNKGWMEIHSKSDYEIAKKILSDSASTLAHL